MPFVSYTLYPFLNLPVAATVVITFLATLRLQSQPWCSRVRLPAPPLAPRASWQLCAEPPAPFPSSPSPEALVPARYRRCLGWALQLGLAQPLPRAWCLQWSYSWSCSCKGRLLARALGWRGLWGTAPVFVCLQNMFWMRNDSSGSECRLTFAMLEEGCQHCIDAACGPLPGGN